VPEPVHITAGLLDALLEHAAESEPESASVALGSTDADAFDDPASPGEGAILTHFYLPDAGRANRAVFGMDLAVSPGGTAGRFLSHPDGDPTLSARDDLHATVIVAVPPWTREDCVAYDRSGSRRPLHVLDIEPPEEQVP
jgi:proteasome lid subunit RPN8/RPN11